jgi:hypothetical protein
MTIESYDMMKITFDYFSSGQFHPCVKNPLFVVVYDTYSDNIHSGWANPLNVDIYDDLYVKVDEDEVWHFNRKIYEEKIAELTVKVKEYNIKKKLQSIEDDFEE